MTDAPIARRQALTVCASGRLHLGFLDPAGTLGRPFGSLGLAIDGFETVVELAAAHVDAVTAETAPAQSELGRAFAYLERLRERTGCRQALRLRLVRVLPAHAGFGSGTQLALAIGRAFARWHGLDIDSATLAGWLGRGLRSGVGIAGFDRGGLLLDGGPGADGVAAPVLSRIEFPEAWRIIVAQDLGLRGLSGSREKQAIATLAPLPKASAAEICHQVLMRVLPGAAEADFLAFAAGVVRVQQVLGEHFAPAQGGAPFTSAAVGQLLQWIAEAHRGRPYDDGAPHGAAIGQSSWGPTGFAILPSQAAAQAAVRSARDAGLVSAGLRLDIVRGRNHGAALAIV
ncbi:MAG: beta-ribofuranosylaminobenzene 5'-phosphate synthase [Rubrivivax sp.]|nr:beta-ribofuranosylaminobenzene 5'-phosphate synthase [Rubrivivax sp.]MDH5338143.1 beta-ribofuranosylaminobenzene 5'-phosphate synthase [Rubrivivax sp.]